MRPPIRSIEGISKAASPKRPPARSPLSTPAHRKCRSEKYSPPAPHLPSRARTPPRSAAHSPRRRKQSPESALPHSRQPSVHNQNPPLSHPHPSTSTKSPPRRALPLRVPSREPCAQWPSARPQQKPQPHHSFAAPPRSF